MEKERIRNRTSCQRTGINLVNEGARPENKKGWKTTSVLTGEETEI